MPKPPNKKRKRLYLDLAHDLTPDVSSAINMLDCLGSEHDPVWLKLNNGKWLELEDGLYEYGCGGRIHFDKPHKDCPSCTCSFEMNFGGDANEFKIKFHGSTGLMEGTLFDMILDRLGILL